MQRLIEYRGSRSIFHDFASVHDRQPIADLIMHAHIMRNDDQGVAHLPLQIRQHEQNALLHHDIQRRRRLVRQHHLRMQNVPSATSTRCFMPPLN